MHESPDKLGALQLDGFVFVAPVVFPPEFYSPAICIQDHAVADGYPVGIPQLADYLVCSPEGFFDVDMPKP